MASVTLEKINKVFGRDHIIKDVDLTIGDGEFVVFVGPSGCGKSTLLRLIAGLESITDGDLNIGDTLVNDLPHENVVWAWCSSRMLFTRT